jgi:hypothetical protein
MVEPAIEPAAIPPRFMTRVGGHLYVAGALILLIILTRPFTLGDTSRYVNEILPYYGRSPFGANSHILEFGHLLWRPVGWMLLQAGAPALSPWFDGSLSGICAAFLISINVIAGFFTVLIWHSLARGVAESRAVAFLLALAFACANAFLAYSRSGCAYVAGLFFVSLSVWIVYRARQGKTGAGTAAWMAGLALAVAILFWLPYVLSVPAVVFAGLQGRSRRELAWGNRQTLLFGARLLVTCAMAVTLCFGAALVARQIKSVAEAKTWAVASGNGWAQTNRPIRIATGLPRSFLYFGNDGVLYKRFLWKDPYNPVSVSRLAGASLWKLAFFYLFAAALTIELIVRPGNRGALALLLTGAAPAVLFAIFVFEPGSPERYFPIYPFLILAIAGALRDYPRSRRPLQHVIVVFLAGMMVTNVYSMFRPRIDREDASLAARLLPLKQRLQDRDLIAVLNNQDALCLFLNRSPFHPLNQPKLLRLYDVIEPASVRVARWREEFAEEALQAWRQGGEVWVSKRLWAAQPLPEWEWVEGDDRRITWKEIPAFFGQLRTVGEVGGADGFLRLLPEGSNLDLLASIAGNPTPADPR